MHSFQLFSNRNRRRRRSVGVPLEQLNGSQNSIMVSNIMAQQKRYPQQPRSFKSSMINYVNAPSASCGCSGH
jgi:hypothetical protein